MHFMHAREMILTGLALSLLAGWELSIAEIPLGLFSISHATQEILFTGIIMLKFLVSAVLLSRGLLQLARGKPTHLIPTHASLHCKLHQQQQKASHPNHPTTIASR